MRKSVNPLETIVLLFKEMSDDKQYALLKTAHIDGIMGIDRPVTFTITGKATRFWQVKPKGPEQEAATNLRSGFIKRWRELDPITFTVFLCRSAAEGCRIYCPTNFNTAFMFASTTI